MSQVAPIAFLTRHWSREGAIHVLVNNAGRSWGVATEDIDEARTQEVIELNLKSVLFLSRRLVLHARGRGGGGSILQISSTAGITGFQRRAVYTATKFGVIGLTKVLALITRGKLSCQRHIAGASRRN